VNPELAAQTPFGTTIAHGYLTLSLLSVMAYQAMPGIKGTRMGVNYGLNKVRFLSAGPVDSRIRVRSELADAVAKDPGTVDLTVRHTIEIDGVEKPAAVAEMIARVLF
jgi:acyl dehydratase